MTDPGHRAWRFRMSSRSAVRSCRRRRSGCGCGPRCFRRHCSRVSASPRGPLGSDPTGSSAVIGVASVPDRHDRDEQHIVFDRIDDAVVTDPDAVAGPTLKGARSRRTGIVREKRERALDTWPICGMDTTQPLQRRRSHLNPVRAHQPRSDFTCSQGMLSPSSAMASSKAAMSSASSRAVSMRSYCAGLTIFSGADRLSRWRGATCP